MPIINQTKEPKAENPDVFAPPKESDSTSKKTKAPDLSTLTAWLSFAIEASRKKHWEWFVIDQFLRGNHNVKGNPNDNTITVTRRTESINYPINKVYTTFRAVRAFVTRHKPKIEVEPEESSDASKSYARKANKLIDRDNQLNNGKRLNKEWVYYGVKYGVGWRQIGYDKDKKMSIRWSVDPFDLLVGSKNGKAEDAPYLIKTLIRTVGYWKHKYPNANVVADNEIAADEYKKLMMEINFQNAQNTSQPTDEQTAIGYECWYRLFEPNSMGGLINKVLFTEQEILQFEETPYDEYPFVPYEAEVLPNEMYPDGHLKHVIAPQRMFNLLNTQLLEYNHIVNRGRWLKDKNAGFRVINAKEGQIIERNPGKRVEALPTPALNPALERHLDLTEKWIEDIGGQHDASFGATPERLTSGKAIESLQAGDSNNISDLRDNFEDALAKEAAWILKMYSLFEKDGIVLEDEDKEGKTSLYGAVGMEANGGKVPEKYYIEDDGTYCEVLAVLPDNKVKVSVNSELGETREARFEMLKELVTLGLPFKSLLEYMEFPNTTDVLERIAEETVADMMAQKMAQPPQQPPTGTPNGQEEELVPMPGDNEAVNAELQDLLKES